MRVREALEVLQEIDPDLSLTANGYDLIRIKKTDFGGVEIVTEQDDREDW